MNTRGEYSDLSWLDKIFHGWTSVHGWLDQSQSQLVVRLTLSDEDYFERGRPPPVTAPRRTRNTPNVTFAPGRAKTRFRLGRLQR